MKASKLEEVNRALEDPAVWDNAERAQELGKEKRQLEDVVLTLRLMRATAGGVGGHAEWVRDVSTRPRMRQSPAWLVGSVLVALGASLALFMR